MPGTSGPQKEALSLPATNQPQLHRPHVDGVVAGYELGAVLAFPPGHLAIGTEAIRQVYAELLTGPPASPG